MSQTESRFEYHSIRIFDKSDERGVFVILESL